MPELTVKANEALQATMETIKVLIIALFYLLYTPAVNVSRTGGNHCHPTYDSAAAR